MKKKEKMKWVYSIPMQNYLGEHNIWPITESETSNAAGYKDTKELRDAQENFYIEHYLFRNKHF